MLCSFCEPITIQGLLDLTQREFANLIFPPTAYYQHHASFPDLIAAADKGCELCQLIHRACRETPAEGNAAHQSTASDIGEEGKSLLSVLKGREKTDVKIALGALNENPGDAINFMMILDVLMVQIGHVWEYPDPTDRARPVYAPTALKFMLLNITVHPYYAPIYFGEHRIGRGRLDPNLGSDYNFKIAQKWLSDCSERHETCLWKKENDLPTRLIEICFERAPRVVIMNGAKGEYRTLSHCWGGEVTPVLTTKSLEEFQKEIRVADLPANFTDAMLIALRLGLNYIWIDSLCVLQDSREDWESESGKMAAIYRNSTVTIAALTSPGCKHGILNGGGEKPDEENPPTIRLTAGSGYGEHETVMLDCHPKITTSWELTPDAALRKRAWTLQETFLSPRTLYYGSRQLYFQCPKGNECTEGIGSSQTQDPDSFHRMGDRNWAIHMRMHDTGNGDIPFGRGEDSAEMILLEYPLFVAEYTTRELTFDSDKLCAFSGIAETFHAFVGGEYLARLWSQDLPRGLLWSTRGFSAPHVRHPYRAPSWSWLVTNEPVDLGMMEYTSESEYVQLVGYDFQPKDTRNPYGEINYCSLTLKGLTMKLVWTTRLQPSLEIPVARATFDERKYPDNCNGKMSDQVFQVTTDNEEHLVIVDGDEASQDTENAQVEEFKEYLVLLVRSRTLGRGLEIAPEPGGPIDRDGTGPEDELAEGYGSLSLEESKSLQAQKGHDPVPEESHTALLMTPECANEQDVFVPGVRDMDHGMHGDLPVTSPGIEEGPFKTGDCLVLGKTSSSQSEETYERVGLLDFLPYRFHRERWERRTLKLR